MKRLISASLLASDFSKITEEIKHAEQSGVDWIHYDVMDGLFVRNISFGEPVLAGINRVISIPIDVHLMITEPIRYVDNYAALGADGITVHYEAAEDIAPTLERIAALGCKTGLALKPATPVSVLEPFLDRLDLILIMTVEPGFGGQVFLSETLEKITQARNLIDRSGRDIRLQVDGGINAQTAKLVKNAGADVLVSGSYLFKSSNMSLSVDLLRG